MNYIKIVLDAVLDNTLPRYMISIVNPDTKKETNLVTFIGDNEIKGFNEKSVLNSINDYINDKIGVDMSTLDRQIIKTYDYLEYLRTLGKSYGTSEENYMTAKRIKEQFNEYLNSLPEDKRRLINAYIDQIRL